jgi:hypothetical protein
MTTPEREHRRYPCKDGGTYYAPGKSQNAILRVQCAITHTQRRITRVFSPIWIYKVTFEILPFSLRNTYFINDAVRLAIECRFTSIEPRWQSKQSESTRLDKKIDTKLDTIRTCIFTCRRRSADVNKEGDDRSGNRKSTATANEIRTGSAGTTHHRTWHTADVKGTRKSMKSRASAPRSSRSHWLRCWSSLPNRKHHRTDRMHNRLQPTVTMGSIAPSTTDQKARFISNRDVKLRGMRIGWTP